MPVPGLSLLGLKRIRGFVSILRYINPTIIIIITAYVKSTGYLRGWNTYYPVNIRNVLKWFKPLQNVFKTYLNPILRFSKCFHVNVYDLIF